jgi:hypothetical protein
MQHKWSKFKCDGEISFGNQNFGKKIGTLSIFFFFFFFIKRVLIEK